MTDEGFNANRRDFLGASALLLSSVAVAASAGGPAAASTSAGVRSLR